MEKKSDQDNQVESVSATEETNCDSGQKSAQSDETQKSKNPTDIFDEKLKLTLAELEKAKAKSADLEDQLLRQRAEFENTRKAIYKEADKRVGIAVKKNVTKFLTVMGAFNQGIQAAEKASDIAGVVSGMKMVESMFTNALVELDVMEVNAAPGVALDPSVHQVISKVETNEYPPNSIVTVVGKGYTYQGLLLQPAMVIVSAPVTEKT